MIALLLGFALAAPAAPTQAPSLDSQCYRLMAGLAESDDPAARKLGLTFSLYFLGRMEADGREAQAVPTVAPTPELIRRCSEIVESSGRDFSQVPALLDDRPDA